MKTAKQEIGGAYQTNSTPPAQVSQRLHSAVASNTGPGLMMKNKEGKDNTKMCQQTTAKKQPQDNLDNLQRQAVGR